MREQAEATKRQAELSAAALEASVRPVLVGVPPDPADETETISYASGPTIERFQRSRIHYQEAGDHVFFSVPLRNVGGGVAFVQRVSVLTGRTPYQGKISGVVIPPRELARVRFSLPLVDQQGQRTDLNEITAAGRGFVQFTIYVVYAGASRELVTASKITVAQFPEGEFHVTRNEILERRDYPAALDLLRKP